MKKVIFLILLSGFYVFSIAQTPKKKDTRIFVATSDTSNLINRISIALFDKGYNPDIKDPQTGIILTKEKDFRTYSVRIRALITDTAIIFSGQGRFFSLTKGDKDDDFEDIYFGGAKGSDLRLAWEQIEGVARKFGSIIRFSK